MMIGCFGRFTRQQRAHKQLFAFGAAPLNTYNIPVDFAKKAARLKYGVGGLRVWLVKSLRTISSIKKTFKKNRSSKTLDA